MPLTDDLIRAGLRALTHRLALAGRTDKPCHADLHAHLEPGTPCGTFLDTYRGRLLVIHIGELSEIG